MMCSSDRPSISTVPLATLVCATKPPAGSTKDVILSPEGRKRYFVVHGGLFSKDDVTLDDIRKIKRAGQQPGQEGLMCKPARQRRISPPPSRMLTRAVRHPQARWVPRVRVRTRA